MGRANLAASPTCVRLQAPMAPCPRWRQLVEHCQVELPKALGVGKEVEPDNLAVPDRNRADRERLPVPEGDGPGDAVDQRQPEGMGEQRLVLGIDPARAVDKGIGHPPGERLPPPRLARAEHVQRDPSDDGRQPPTEVLHLVRVNAVQPQPGLLDGIVGLTQRAQHPVGHRSQPRSMLLESLCQPVALFHLSHPFLAPCHSSRPPRSGGCDQRQGEQMRVFVAGASGAIGTRLLPQLIERGHEVIGSSRSPEKAESLRALGAKPIALDLLDARAVRKAVLEAAPDAIVHQVTALAGARFGRNFDRTFAQTNRLRTEGTDNLLAAAREAGVSRFVAQSNPTFRYAREGGMVKSEDDPLDTKPVAGAVKSRAAMNYLDDAVVAAGGIALRYGIFYGAANDGLIEPVRKRQFPIVGDGGGFMSWIHLDDAAAATVLALEHDGPAIYNIVDDEPAPAREWLPALADALGAKPPRHVPVWLARLFAGEPGVVMGTEARGASNAKAKRELGWTPSRPTIGASCRGSCSCCIPGSVGSTCRRSLASAAG